MRNIKEVRTFVLANYFQDPIGAHEGLAEAWKISVEQDCEVRLEIGYRSRTSSLPEGTVSLVIVKGDKIEALHSRLENAMREAPAPARTRPGPGRGR